MDMNTRKLLAGATNRFLDAPKRLLIGGEWVDAADGAALDVRDPATGASGRRCGPRSASGCCSSSPT